MKKRTTLFWILEVRAQTLPISSNELHEAHPRSTSNTKSPNLLTALNSNRKQYVLEEMCSLTQTLQSWIARCLLRERIRV